MDNTSTDGRRAARTNVFLSATLVWAGKSTPVRIANLSATGALLFGEKMPVTGNRATLVCGGASIEATVVWAGDSHAGIHFDQEIEPGDVLPKRKGPAKVIVRDDRDVDFRRPGFRGNQLTAEERLILENWKRERGGQR